MFLAHDIKHVYYFKLESDDESKDVHTVWLKEY